MNPIRIILVALLCGALAACDEGSAQTDAAAGAPPQGFHPLGPKPGSGEVEPSQQNPYKNDSVAIQEGRKLFVAFNCYGCHGGRGGGGMAPSLRDPVWKYGNSDRDIFSSIAQGRPHAMPAWGTVLSSDTIWKLTAYIQSLRTEREPAKPRP